MNARVLVLPPGLLAALEAEARLEFPREACGILLGRARAAGWQVERLCSARNVHPDPCTGFEVDPGAILAALEGAGDLRLLGFYHSHPGRPAAPSPADARGAWPEVLGLITAVDASGACATRAYRLERGRFFEIEAR